MRPLPSARFKQQLSKDAAQGVGQHGARLGLLVGREDVDHTIDRFARVVGVQRAEDEQASLGGS